MIAADTRGLVEALKARECYPHILDPLARPGGTPQVTESASFNVTVVKHEIYAAYLLLCRRVDVFSGEITSTFINLDPEGDHTQHLPIEKTMLPSLFAVGQSRPFISGCVRFTGCMWRSRRRGTLVRVPISTTLVDKLAAEIGWLTACVRNVGRVQRESCIVFPTHFHTKKTPTM